MHNYPDFKNLNLPEGLEILIVDGSKKYEEKTNSKEIYLFEKDGLKIYLRISEKKETITIEEFLEFVYSIKTFIDKNLNYREKLQKELRGIWRDENQEYKPDFNSILQEMDWSNGWVPLILLKKSKNNWDKAFINLLGSYFNVPFFEVPISSTTLILIVSNEKIQLSKNQKELSEFSYGLYNMIQDEWNEEIKIGIHYPISTSNELIKKGYELLSDEKWAGMLWNYIEVFSPWTNQLERIIFSIPESKLISLVKSSWRLDRESNKTLEEFFGQNMNMSETARKMFIHRNTLQYRLDKIKQQTGLDVKNFEDAVIAKINILLSKASCTR